MMTPLHLDILLYAHTRPDPYPYPSAAAEIYTQQLVEMELIWRDPDTFVIQTTRKGQVYIDMLLDTPLPVLQYVDPRGPAK